MQYHCREFYIKINLLKHLDFHSRPYPQADYVSRLKQLSVVGFVANAQKQGV